MTHVEKGAKNSYAQAETLAEFKPLQDRRAWAAAQVEAAGRSAGH